MPTNIDIASTAENKITAARIETDCPTELANQGALIAKCLREADDCDACAEECRIAAGKLIAEAYEACDSDGFDAFRKRFFPQVGRSRAYELMAVATGKKSANEIQKSNRERVARYRAKKAAESVTVTDSPRFDTGDKSVTINNSESNASSDVVYLRDWRTGEVSTVCTDNHAHLGVDQPTSAEGGTDKVETLKAETEAQSQVATAAPAIEVVPEKPETLLAHWQRSPWEVRKALIDHVEEMSAKIDPFLKLSAMDPTQAAAKVKEVFGTYKTQLFMDSLRALMSPKRKTKKSTFKNLEMTGTADLVTGQRSYSL